MNNKTWKWKGIKEGKEKKIIKMLNQKNNDKLLPFAAESGYHLDLMMIRRKKFCCGWRGSAMKVIQPPEEEDQQLWMRTSSMNKKVDVNGCCWAGGCLLLELREDLLSEICLLDSTGECIQYIFIHFHVYHWRQHLLLEPSIRTFLTVLLWVSTKRLNMNNNRV